MGIICALITGFALSAVTQVGTIDSSAFEWTKWFFWIASTLCMCTGMHCVVTTTFVNVLGTGLALRGPSGSMVRAVEGMIKEQDAIVVSLIATVVFYQFLMMGALYQLAYEEAGICCAIILFGGIYVWYHYCLRIYNRFKVQSQKFFCMNGN